MAGDTIHHTRRPASGLHASAKPDPLGRRTVILSIVALSTFGIARPLLDLLGRNVELFVAHRSSAVDVIAVAVGLTLVAPVVVGTLILLAVAAHRKTGAAFLSLAVSMLTAAFVLVTFRVTDTGGVVSGSLVLLLAGVVGVSVAALYFRSATLRRVLQVAAIAAPIAAIMFLFATPANRILFPAQDAADALAVPDDAPPIVILVFDEFPVASLLNADGEIDATAFPAFGKLAADATFFNNATTVHARTMDAVPAILSGQRSEPDSLPTTADHPTNIFALLGDRYRMHVNEPVTSLCPPDVCRREPKNDSGARWRSLVRDLAIVEAHLLVPTDMAASLPPLNEGWRDFSRAATGGALRTRRAFLEQGRSKRDKWPTIYRGFVRKIEPAPEPTLHFLHVGGLPHYPWIYLPDGRHYQAAPIEGSGLAGVVGIGKGQVWTEREWPVAQAYQRHLLQVQFVDRLIGELLDKLEREGLYERALVVITADHGASFRPGAPLRKLTADNVGEIGAVPLLIKAPGQRDGTTSTVPAESVDIVPSVLDLLGVEAAIDFDGQSVFDKSIRKRTTKRMTEPEFGTNIVFDANQGQTRAAVARKLALFGAEGHLNLFRLAPPGSQPLLGTKVAPSVAGTDGITVSIQDEAAYDDVDLQAPTVPVLLSGSLSGDEFREPPRIAVAVNGTVAAATQADPPGPDGQYSFRALLPPDALRDGANDLDIFVIDAGGTLLSVPVS